jgi:hypothetical protein
LCLGWAICIHQAVAARRDERQWRNLLLAPYTALNGRADTLSSINHRTVVTYASNECRYIGQLGTRRRAGAGVLGSGGSTAGYGTQSLLLLLLAVTWYPFGRVRQPSSSPEGIASLPPTPSDRATPSPSPPVATLGSLWPAATIRRRRPAVSWPPSAVARIPHLQPPPSPKGTVAHPRRRYSAARKAQLGAAKAQSWGGGYQP